MTTKGSPEHNITRIKKLWSLEAVEYGNVCQILRTKGISSKRRVENIELKMHIEIVSDALLDAYLETIKDMAQTAINQTQKAA